MAPGDFQGISVSLNTLDTIVPNNLESVVTRKSDNAAIDEII
jgi:hypothetical protein